MWGGILTPFALYCARLSNAFTIDGGKKIKMKKEHFSSKAILTLNSISLVLAILCAILNENPVVKGLWVVCSLLWGVRVIMDIRNIIRKKDSENKL